MISTVTVERIVINVTSMTCGMQMTFYLGVVQAVSSKGSDQACVILNLLEYHDIVDQIFAVCWITTSSNTLEQLCCFAQNLEHSPLVVSLQEAHIGSTHLSLHWDIHWREDQGPQRGLCVKL
jgi:hypothetical protein